MFHPLTLLLLVPFLAGAVVFVETASKPSWSVYDIDGWCGTPHPATLREYLRWRRDAAAHGLTPRSHTEADNLAQTTLLFVYSAEAAVGAAALGFLIEYRLRSRRATPRPA